MHWLTPLEITNFLVICILIFLLIFITFLQVSRSASKKLTTPVYVVMTISSLIVSIVVLVFITMGSTFGGDWKTQTILYQHKHAKNRTMEYQMRDVGAAGYNRRVIDKTSIIPFVAWIRRTDPKEIVDTDQWTELNIEINELGLDNSGP